MPFPLAQPEASDRGFPAGRFVFALCLLAALASGGPDPDPALEKIPPPERAEVFEKGLAEMRAADDRIRIHPDSMAPHLDRLRILFILGVKQEIYLEVADAEIDRIQVGFDRDPNHTELLMAYRGAVRVAHAKHGLNPTRKLEHIHAGVRLLDSAVAISPGQPEVRYLRLVSGYYLPFFLFRKTVVKEDFTALAAMLPGIAHQYPPKWFLSVAKFVLTKGGLDQTRQSTLRKCMAEVADAQDQALVPPKADGE
jgi:hypothetical protein